jgi:ATP-binding cassette, subfamily F, member 3
MNEGMDRDATPKKHPEVFEGPLLSSRDKVKIDVTSHHTVSLMMY